jgi:hypothetical protein
VVKFVIKLKIISLQNKYKNMKRSGFKMKNASIAKLAKTAGSPMKQNPSYKEAFDAMTPTKEGTRVDKFGNVYKNSPEGLANFTKAAKAYNAKKNTPKADPKPKADNKPKVDDKSKQTTTTKSKSKVGKFLSKVVGTGAKRKANEANRKKRQNRSVTGRMKAKASKFGRMGT